MIIDHIANTIIGSGLMFMILQRVNLKFWEMILLGAVIARILHVLTKVNL